MRRQRSATMSAVRSKVFPGALHEIRETGASHSFRARDRVSDTNRRGSVAIDGINERSFSNAPDLAAADRQFQVTKDCSNRKQCAWFLICMICRILIFEIGVLI